jgi:hypothetical protein
MKRKKTRAFGFAVGYMAGFLSWLAGYHCLETESQGGVSLSWVKFLRHLLKVFLWAVELTLLFHVLGWYLTWLMLATGPEKVTALLVKSMVFLYIKVFWPEIFPEILPGLHVFSCPQCYQRRTFRFMPVSPRLGNYVTYLCRYCSCLVDGWGNQIFYPSNPKPRITAAILGKSLPAVGAALVLGIAAVEILWRYF